MFRYKWFTSIAHETPWIVDLPVYIPISFYLSLSHCTHKYVCCRWLYWVDRKSQVLERASVNGSDRVVVRRGVRCPWPVTIDHLTYRVYWADECSLQIEAINMNGSEYRPIIDPIMHTVLFPYGISTLGGTLFWTEFRQNPTAFSAAPDHNSDRLLVREIIRGSSRDIFYGIEIVAQTRQPTGTFLTCALLNCTSHLYIKGIYTCYNKACNLHSSRCLRCQALYIVLVDVRLQYHALLLLIMFAHSGCAVGTKKLHSRVCSRHLLSSRTVRVPWGMDRSWLHDKYAQVIL